MFCVILMLCVHLTTATGHDRPYPSACLTACGRLPGLGGPGRRILRGRRTMGCNALRLSHWEARRVDGLTESAMRERIVEVEEAVKSLHRHDAALERIYESL